MIKKLFLMVFALACVNFASAQTMEELKAKKAELETTLGEKQGEIGAIEGELNALKKEIDILSGWITGVSGNIGFDFNKSSNWSASPNPNSSSSSLNLGVTAFANQEGEKAFWRNKGILTKSWSDVDLSASDDSISGDGLFDNGTIDILNISSLAGYKLTDWIALSALGELNTSLENFLDPGTFDIGIGATLTPVENLVIVIHPLNYHFAFSGIDGLESTGAFGAKIRADYTKDFLVASKKVAWSSTFTTFIPYKDKKTQITDTEGNVIFESGLFEYTWLNTLSFQVWKGIGVGISAGVRQADFEFDGTQAFYALGLSYSF